MEPNFLIRNLKTMEFLESYTGYNEDFTGDIESATIFCSEEEAEDAICKY